MAVQAILGALGDRLPLVLPTLAAVLAVLVLQYVSAQKPLAKVPLAGEGLGGDEKRRQAYLFNAPGIYLEGYKKVR